MTTENYCGERDWASPCEEREMSGQHAGGTLFAHDEKIMEWLFGSEKLLLFKFFNIFQE